MKKSRFTDSRIMSILKQVGAGTPVAELCISGVHALAGGCFHNGKPEQTDNVEQVTVIS